jgi:hypothetical protein
MQPFARRSDRLDAAVEIVGIPNGLFGEAIPAEGREPNDGPMLSWSPASSAWHTPVTAQRSSGPA